MNNIQNLFKTLVNLNISFIEYREYLGDIFKMIVNDAKNSGMKFPTIKILYLDY